jgi:hypothetical protein
MNLLFLVSKHEFETKMSRVRFEEVEALKVASPVVNVHTSGPGWPDWPEGQTPVGYVTQRCLDYKDNLSEKPHVVLSYGVTGLTGSPLPVAMIFHETYNWKKTLSLIRETGATLVIFTYVNDVATYQEVLADYAVVNGHPPAPRRPEIVHIPHGADGAIYRDYGLPKDIDVLVAGNLAREFYPFRARLANLALREVKKRGYRVVTLPHPGFTIPIREGTAIGVEYARWLNRSKLVVSCSSRQKYAFCKLVEIPLCWALPVSDLPAERQGFFRQTMLNVEMWESDRQILGKIEDVLDDEGLRVKLTTIAHDKVAQRLTLAHWAERFIYAARRHVWGESPAPPTPMLGEEDLVAER